ncbi:LysR family transcriptional regulator [Litorisediminicola beolgyonensis]|uniref:LysR family transcriptional regulator n=1 Tax=Litorisediminicola beolgyonensis TaxID=1173614 RepID=A0ABW3ZJ24_9RHOB
MRLAGSDLRLLSVFDAVVRHGGFAAAQTELNIGPSTISNHISALEERLGCTLCQRGRGGFRVTEKGQIVHAEAQKLLASIDGFSESVSTLRGKLVGTLRVGIVDAIATDGSSRLSETFGHYFGTPNGIHLEVRQLSPQDLLQRIYDGLIDVGVGSFPNKLAGLTYEELYHETHSLYFAMSHPLARRDIESVSVEDLAGFDVVGRGYWRDRMHGQLGLRNVKAIVYEIEPQLILIRSGKFIGFLPDHFADHWVKQGVLGRLPLSEAGYGCSFELVYKKAPRQGRAVRKFIDTVLEMHRS